MRRFYFFWGAAFVAFMLLSSPLGAQNQCPTKILYDTKDPCGLNQDGFYFYFQSNTGVPSSFTVQFESISETPPCIFNSGGPAIKQTSCGKTWWFMYSSGCTKTPSGWFTFGSGKRCFYRNGLLETCDDFLVPCTDELAKFAKDLISVPGANCKQWEGPCNTESEIYRSGAVAIGTDNKYGDLAGYKLAVKGGIASEMLQLCKGEWCDYVFSDSFRLMPLPEVEQYIQANRHLPGCTPGPVIEREGGFSLGDETVHQQEKIEEAFLHLIALRKQIDVLSARTERLGLPQAPAGALETTPAVAPQKEMDAVKVPNTAAPLVLSIQCYQTKPATGDNTTDGIGGIKVTGGTGALLTVTWTGPGQGSTTMICSDGVILLTGLKKGTYTVTVSSAGSPPQVCTLIIAKGTPVSCGKLAEEPCKSAIFDLVKSEFSETPPTCKQWDDEQCNPSAHIHRLGNVGIGTSTGRTGYSLAVKGGILTDRFFIELCEKHGWCDYVFDPDYPLPDLYEVERYVKSHQHLPGTVSQVEVTNQGGIEMRSVKLDQQKKIEESYLYLIEMNKKVEALKNQIKSFE